MKSDLLAAGITDPQLQSAYERCRVLNAEHGKTYYLATLLLPPAKRPFVHALYGFARYADEIVDDLDSTLTDAEKSAALTALEQELASAVASGGSEHPVLAAVVDTVLRWQIPMSHFTAFMHSMRMDLTVESYQTYEDLYEYVYGSAAVIGLQMVPILQPADPIAYHYATKLGEAFQLANFIRDVGEDLLRGRIYVPLQELAAFDVTPQVLQQRVATPAVKAALAAQVAHVRALEAQSRPGIALLHPSVQPCIEAARVLYCGIVDAVESIDYEIFDQRATVGMSTRLRVAGPAWIAARQARRRYGTGKTPDRRA